MFNEGKIQFFPLSKKGFLISDPITKVAFGGATSAIGMMNRVS